MTSMRGSSGEGKGANYRDARRRGLVDSAPDGPHLAAGPGVDLSFLQLSRLLQGHPDIEMGISGVWLSLCRLLEILQGLL